LHATWEIVAPIMLKKIPAYAHSFRRGKPGHTSEWTHACSFFVSGARCLLADLLHAPFE
jgi:hypothetical protein